MEKRFYQQLLDFDFNEPCALCTVMEWKGSVPRKDFPMMLVFKSGKTVGTIGGGTMEKEAIERALVSLENNQTSLDSFDFTNDDLSKDGGLCGGTVKVAIEPYTNEVQSFWAGLDNMEKGQTWLTSYHFQTKKITRHLLESRNEISGVSVGKLIQDKKSKTIVVENAIHLFRYISPSPILHIFGGGHVGKAVGELAHYIDIDITIYDDRKDFVSEERFPFALSRSFEPLGSYINNTRLSSNALALVATRGHHHDLKLIRWILKSNAQWIGLVSSKRKWMLLAQRLENEGVSQLDLSRVHAPVGVDINSQTVPEIAVSIIGGIIYYLRSKKEVLEL